MTQTRAYFRTLIAGTSLLAIGACTTQVPDSAQGVGFNDYDSYEQRRELVLEGRAPTTILPPPPVTHRPLGAIAAPVRAAGPTLEDAEVDARQGNSGVEPLNAAPDGPAGRIVENATTGMSAENDFNAVSETRSIEGDAALIAQNRAQYVIIQPEALPTRPGTDTPNIVAYALQTNNPKGTPLYRRGGFRTENQHLRNCAAFSSPDLAQEAFLAAGGPERDRQNLDPDGDGFACAWDPAPFRAVRN